MSRDALVVGINTYQYLPSLKAPARDAEGIAAQLHSHGEFRVHRLPEVIHEGRPQIGQKTRVTLRELETALINLFKPKGRSIPQTAIFYFSGHGIQRDAGIQEGYLALSDSNPEQGFYGLSLFWLRRLLQESPVRQRVIWLDCCHSGEFLNFLEADPGAHPGTDRLFMAASREYETAYESLDSDFSVFTDALLSGLDPNRVTSGIVTNHSLTDWVNLTLKGEIQQPLFESSGSEIILTRCQVNQSSTPATAAAKDICPYRGLEFFDESQAEYFFGREEIVDQLVKKLAAESFVAVVGASGSGKSSLVRAGLMAQLRQGKKIPGSHEWKMRLITPTEHPLKSLAAAFIDSELNDLERAEQLRRAETFLKQGGDGLSQLLRASLSADRSTGLSVEQRPQFLLVIDQFEEIFTLHRGAEAERERQEFFDCLLYALSTVESLKVVIVLRADFFSKCSVYEGLAQQILPHQIEVPSLKYEQIKAAIVRPAQKVGLICEPNLIYTLMMDVIGAPGELPLLQSILLALWQKRRIDENGIARLTLDAYQEIEGAKGSLQKQATETFYSLSPEEQTVAKRIFLSLTQLGEGTEDTRRRVMKAELVSPTFSIHLVEQVLEKLVAAKLVIVNQEDLALKIQTIDRRDASASTASFATSVKEISTKLSLPCGANEIVDIAHEALIRTWPLLRTWLDQGREVLRRQRRIELAAQEWHQAGQPAVGEYLLYGLRLRDAEDFLRRYPQELSVLAQHYIGVSYSECCRVRRTSKRLRIGIPALLVATLTIVLNQYYGVVRTQLEKEDQLQKAVSRERVAIAQSVLQDANADPMSALLISRLAAEAEHTAYDAESTLRKALQSLHLQSEQQGQQGTVQQVAFSPDRQYLGSAGADGTVQLWTVTQSTYRAQLTASKVLVWDKTQNQKPVIKSIAFSSDGTKLAAIAQDSETVKIWSVASGELLHQLIGSAPIQQIRFSSNNEGLVTLDADRRITLWKVETGLMQAQLPGTAASFQFGSENKVLVVREDNNIQLWQLVSDAAGTLQLNLSKTLPAAEGVKQAEFSSSGRWIVVLGKDDKVRLWNSQTGQLESLLPDISSSKNKVELPETNDANLKLAVVQQIKLSADERTIATVNTQQEISLWDIQSGQLITQLNGKEAHPNSEQLPLIQFSADRQLLVTTNCGSENASTSVCLWNQQGQLIGQLEHQTPVTAVEFSSDGTYVVTASEDGLLHLWTTELGGDLPTVNLANTPVKWLTFLPNGLTPNQSVTDGIPSQTNFDQAETAATAQLNALQPTQASSGFAFLQNLLPWRSQGSVHSDTDQVTAQGLRDSLEASGDRSVAIPPPVANLLTVSAAGQLQAWKINTPPPVQIAAASPNLSSHFAAIQLEQGSFNLQQIVSTLSQPFTSSTNSKPEPVTLGFAQFSQMHFLNLMSEVHPPDSLLKKLAVPADSPSLSSFAVSPNGLFLAAADIEGWITVYRIQNHQANQAEQAFQRLYRIRNWQSDHNASTPVSQVVRSEQSSTQPSAVQSVGTPTAIRFLTFSPDSQQLLGVADDLTLRSWRTFSGKSIAVLQGHTATVKQARYSEDGQWIVSASWDGTARIWQASTGRMIKALPHQDAVSSASFSSGGQVVTASWNGTVQTWQLNDSKPQLQLNHQKSVLDAQFSPDGQLIVTASTDGTARLWNAVTGEMTGVLQPATEEKPAIVQAAFSPDGQYVTTLDQNGRVNLWAANKDTLLQIARERSLRQLTPEECRQYLKLPPQECPSLPS